MRYSIIIPTIGNTNYLQACVASFEKYHTENYEIIVVDDGSDEKNQEFLRSYCNKQRIRCICHPKNEGFAHTVNLGLVEARGDVLILVNNDIVFTHHIFINIESTFKSDPKIGVIGALLYYPNQTVQHAGMIYQPETESFVHKPFKKIPLKAYVPAVTGALFIFKRELLKTVGVFNEEYFLACEDTDYCLRAWAKDYRVLFTPTVAAIHHEGATRGNTPKTKLKKSKDWTVKEQRSIVRFKQNLKKFNLLEILTGINELNYEPLKIEVGSGYNPHPGYKHLDIRKDLPDLDYVCNFSKTKLPFMDGEVSEILANHVIEHISFRKLPFVLGEWKRVLKRGGKLILRTPDLRFICEKYLKGEVTPEWPGDEAYIKENLSKDITPSWWANLKLFSGQDYEANFHHVCFDFEMLKNLLEKYGFSRVKRIKMDKEFSPGELQVEAFKQAPLKEACILLTQINKNVLVVRAGALGDVILTTPIIKRLYGEGWSVDVTTECVEVFKNNPYVHEIFNENWGNPILTYELKKLNRPVNIIDLDLAYEKNPKMHIIDAYSLEAFGDTKTEKQTYLYLTEEGGKKAKELLQGFRSFICIHMGVGWENRTWPYKSWEAFISKFPVSVSTVLVGSGKDFSIEWLKTNHLNLLGKTDYHTLCSVIERAKLFIGSDSAPLHIAQSFGVPSIGLYTSAKAEYRALKVLAVTPDIDCYGCLHDEKPPVTYCGCRRGDFKCLDLITPEQVYKIVESVL